MPDDGVLEGGLLGGNRSLLRFGLLGFLGLRLGLGRFGLLAIPLAVRPLLGPLARRRGGDPFAGVRLVELHRLPRGLLGVRGDPVSVLGNLISALGFAGIPGSGRLLGRSSDLPLDLLLEPGELLGQAQALVLRLVGRSARPIEILGLLVVPIHGIVVAHGPTLWGGVSGGDGVGEDALIGALRAKSQRVRR